MDSCDLRSELTKTTDEIDEPPPRLSISAAIGVLDFKQCDIRIPGILLKDGPVSRSMLFEDHSLNVGSPRFCRFNRCSYRENRRSEEHTSELQSLMRTSSAVFCLQQKKKRRQNQQQA